MSPDRDGASILREKIFFGILLIIFASLGAITARGQSLNLDPPRTRHTATLLNSGQVLIAGGINESGPLNSALLYDPVSGTLSPTGPMTVARADHTVDLTGGW